MKLAPLILAAILAVNASAAPVTPRVVTKSGVRTFHLFRDRFGVVARHPCTLAEFNALFVKGSRPPTLANHTYLRSISVADMGTAEVSFSDLDALAVQNGVVVGLDGARYLLSGAQIAGGKITAGTYGPITVDAHGRIEKTGVVGTESVAAVGK